MRRVVWMGAMMLALVLALAGCEAKKTEAGKKEEKTPAKEAAEAPSTPETTPEQPVVEPVEAPAAPEVVLATVTPVAAPEDWPSYAKVDEIPEDALGDVMTRNEAGRPSVFTLKNDAVFQTYPCQGGERISVYVNGDAIAGCTLGIDYAVAEGIELAKGTEIKTQPSGAFTGFVLKAPQRVAGVPVAANQTVYWTPSSGLGSVTLAADANVLGIDFKAGTSLTFRSNARMQSLQGAQLAGEHSLGGTAYTDGQRLEFDENNAVVKAE